MILVTGGLGFIGAHTSRALLDLGERCVIAQRRVGQVPDLLAPDIGHGAVVEQMDCADLASVLAVGQRHEITGIVHLAAVGMGPGSPLEELWLSAQVSVNMLRAALTWGVSRVVQASTIGVYAGVSADVFREDAPLPMASVHPIPAAKKSAEIFASVLTDLDVVSARIGAIWGPLGRASSPFFATPQLVHAAAAGQQAPPVYADDAIDMLYVRDCGRAIAMAQTAKALEHRTYNIGSGRATTNREVATAISRVVPGATPVFTEGRSPTPVAHLDISRLRADTGFVPEYDLDRGIADYLGWLGAGHAR
jgi:UDP-glucose 4-epimerase